MEIYVFCRNRVNKSTLDDGEGGAVSLSEHMDYVLNCGGTPDCVDIRNLRHESLEEIEEHYPQRDYVLVNEHGREVETE